jgi:drug/metabolite transporter (DMT)-like permease
MLDALFWGMIAALSLGTADYLARATSQAVGPVAAFTYVVMFGTVLMAGFMLVAGIEFRITPFGLWMSGLHGLCVTAMSLMLYAALVRGPVSLVVPLVAAHPILVILYDVVVGQLSLSAQQILAAALVIAGVTGASVFSFKHDHRLDFSEASPSQRKHVTLVLALGACIAYALLIITGQSAAAEMGQASVALVGRTSSAVILLVALALGLFKLPPPGRAIRPLTAQGVLDTLGYVALLAGGSTIFPGMTAVVGSMFGFITIVLARIFIFERIGRTQWLSIALSFAGVAWLVNSSS